LHAEWANSNFEKSECKNHPQAMDNFSGSMLAVIMGGGAGTRLFPLTAVRSKPAVPIAGKYRLVDIPISNCINSDIHRMFVLTQFNSASLNKHIKNTYHFSIFSKAFVDILAAEQTPETVAWYQGTADAVRRSLHHLATYDFEYALILSGDQLYQMDFIEMLENHIEHDADLSIACIPVAEKDASDFGIMKTNNEGYITSFIEKPKKEVVGEWVSEVSDDMKLQKREFLASMGIYIFNRKLLFDLLLNEHRGAADFGKDVIPRTIEAYKVAAYQYEGYWTDIGNIRSFFEANIALTDEVPAFNLFDNKRYIYTHPRMLPPSKISGTTIDSSIIADGCIIKAKKIERTVVGNRTRVGTGTTISNTYLMGNDAFETLEDITRAIAQGKPLKGVGDNCFIQNAIIDKDCRIGSDVRIVGGDHLPNSDTNLLTVKDGIVVIKKEAVIPSGFSI
jgi:glucose-1-phosphate adenylyltransferase